MSMTEDTSPQPDARRRKLAYRAAHRGTKEMDLILGGYVSRHIAALSETELDELEQIIALPDADLDAWATGKAELPAEYDTKLMESILSFSYKPDDYT